MTKEEFISKHGEFCLNEISNEMLAQACHTPEEENNYGSIFFLEGKMYNHGFFNNTIDVQKLETDWNLLSENIELSNKLETLLEDIVFSSEIDEYYKSFILTDFEYKKDSFLEAFFKKMGYYFKADGLGVYTNPLFEEIQVENIGENDSLLMTEEPFEDYYEDVEIMREIDQLMKDNLKNIRRISFNQSYSFSGTFPTFFIGETKNGNNLVGLFSIGSYT